MVIKKKKDQSKWKSSREAWRAKNPDYARNYYKEVVLKDPEKIHKNIERSKEWQKLNKEKAYKTHLKYRESCRNELKEKTKIWIKNNREIYLKNRRISTKHRKATDPVFKFSETVRSLISGSFKRKYIFKKKNKTEEILGCSLEFFRGYILSKCPENTTLSDFGRYGYHIDHKIPVDSAKTEEDILKLNHYTNLQPLWWEDNLSKSNKMPEMV